MTDHENPVNTGLGPFPESAGNGGERVPARRSPFPPPYRGERDANTRKPTPTWLAEKISVSRRAAQPDTCRQCGANILVGPDDDRCSITARVDAQPVTPLAEAVAYLDGHRYSCDLIRGALWHRAPHHTQSPTHPHPIHLQHDCPKET